MKSEVEEFVAAAIAKCTCSDIYFNSDLSRQGVSTMMSVAILDEIVAVPRAGDHADFDSIRYSQTV